MKNTNQVIMEVREKIAGIGAIAYFYNLPEDEISFCEKIVEKNPEKPFSSILLTLITYRFLPEESLNFLKYNQG